MKTRSRIAEGVATLGKAPVEIAAPVQWGENALYARRSDGGAAASSTTFHAGWHAPADTASTPDLLEFSLDLPAHRSGDTAMLRLVPRAAGTALFAVLSNRLVAMQAVEVTIGENLIHLPVTHQWVKGVYVTVSGIRPMDLAAGRNPAHAPGLTHASIDPDPCALSASIEAARQAAPRGPAGSTLPPGESLTFGQDVLAGLIPGIAKATLATVPKRRARGCRARSARMWRHRCRFRCLTG